MDNVLFWGLTGTHLVALLGAVTGVIALGLDVARFLRSGPSLRLDLAPNMELLTEDGQRCGVVFAITAVNVGDADTKLTGLVFRVTMPRRYLILRGRIAVRAMAPVKGLPAVVPPGGDVHLLLPQAAVMEAVEGSVYATLEITHTMGPPVRAVIPLRKLK